MLFLGTYLCIAYFSYISVYYSSILFSFCKQLKIHSLLNVCCINICSFYCLFVEICRQPRCVLTCWHLKNIRTVCWFSVITGFQHIFNRFINQKYFFKATFFFFFFYIYKHCWANISAEQYMREMMTCCWLHVRKRWVWTVWLISHNILWYFWNCML